MNRKHITNDVYPYTCVMEDCTKEDVLYTTKEAWKTHLTEDHRSTNYWVCLPCGGDTQLPTEADFISHTKQEHQETILEDQIPLLVPISRRSVPADITACPLCDAWSSKDSGEVDREALIDHIAEEIHAFSLRALPWPSEDDEVWNAERAGVAVLTVQDWLTRWNLTHPDAKEHLPYNNQPKMLDRFHYFRSHPYFAESGADDTASRRDSNDSATSNLRSLKNEGSLTFTDSENGRITREANNEQSLIWEDLSDQPRVPQTHKSHSESINSVAFSPNGKMVVSASDDPMVRLWDSATGALLQTLKGHSDWVNAVAFSPDGRELASASHDKTIKLWDRFTEAPPMALEGHLVWVNAVAYSPDSKLVASASDDMTVRLWDSATGVLLQTLNGHLDRVNAVAFSPDGKLVASASDDMTVRLWNSVTGTPWDAFKSHLGRVNAVAFSPDGKLVASASDDTTVRLWDLTTEALLQTLKGHSGCVNAVAFSPDGKLVASASGDMIVRLWDSATGISLQMLEDYASIGSAGRDIKYSKPLASCLNMTDTSRHFAIRTRQVHRMDIANRFSSSTIRPFWPQTRRNRPVVS
jgi:WD40 repeat protein